MNYCRTAREAAAYVKVSLGALRYAIRTGNGPVLSIAKRTTRSRVEKPTLVYTHAELDRWAAEHRSDALTTPRAAAYLGLSPGYLGHLRHYKRGPKYTGKGRTIRYTKADLDAWNANRTRRAAAEAERLIRRAEALMVSANRLKSLTDRPATVSTEAFE